MFGLSVRSFLGAIGRRCESSPLSFSPPPPLFLTSSIHDNLKLQSHVGDPVGYPLLRRPTCWLSITFSRNPRTSPRSWPTGCHDASNTVDAKSTSLSSCFLALFRLGREAFLNFSRLSSPLTIPTCRSTLIKCQCQGVDTERTEYRRSHCDVSHPAIVVRFAGILGSTQLIIDVQTNKTRP